MTDRDFNRRKRGRGKQVLAVALCLLAGGVACRVGNAQAVGTITTVAGGSALVNDNGYMHFPYGFGGDGGPATAALLSLNSSIAEGTAVDQAGNLYIADTYNNRIRKVSPDGMITTVAGTGPNTNVYQMGGFSGDGGPATLAQLYQPTDVALDRQGNLFIADSGNLRIRKVTPDGTITTIAGNGNSHYSATNGVIPEHSGDGGPALLAGLGGPAGIALDAQGNLYVAIGSNFTVRKISTDGIITTVAGKPYFRDAEGGPFSSPFTGEGQPATQVTLDTLSDVAVDPTGHLLIADRGQQVILKIDDRGNIVRVAGVGGQYGAGTLIGGFSGDGGPATQAELYWPMGMTVDSSGSIWFADYYNHRVRKVDPKGIISTVAGDGTDFATELRDNGPALSAPISYPTSVTVDAGGNLLITDSWSNRIRKITGIAAEGMVAGQPFSGAPPVTVGPGDLNGDGSVGIGDVLVALNAVVGNITLTPAQFQIADVNGDQLLDLVDVRLILMKAVGL